jgi:hypothetical protein
MPGVVRVAGLARRVDRELGGDRLAEDHRTRGAQQAHDRGVGARPPPGMEHRAVLGRHVGGVDDVLDADRQAVQGPERPAALALLVGGARLPERVLRVEERPGLDLGLARLDPLQAGLDELLRGEPAVPKRRGDVGRAQL